MHCINAEKCSFAPFAPSVYLRICIFLYGREVLWLPESTVLDVPQPIVGAAELILHQPARISPLAVVALRHLQADSCVLNVTNQPFWRTVNAAVRWQCKWGADSQFDGKETSTFLKLPRNLEINYFCLKKNQNRMSARMLVCQKQFLALLLV